MKLYFSFLHPSVSQLTKTRKRMQAQNKNILAFVTKIVSNCTSTTYSCIFLCKERSNNNMSWNGHVADEPAARKMAGSGHIAEDNLGLGTSDITTVTAARTAADAAVLEGHVCDYPVGNQCSRGFEMADNYNATFGSTFAAFYASLPSSAGHPRRAING